jgi:hypothetical protein
MDSDMTPNSSDLIATKTERDSVTIDLIRVEDVDEVLKLLKTYFFKVTSFTLAFFWKILLNSFLRAGRTSKQIPGHGRLP